MIRLCEDWQSLLSRLAEFGAFGVKAACTLAAYGGPTAFLQAFETENGAALLFGGELILCGEEEELCQFALLCPGVKTILCEEQTARKLPLPVVQSGAIMKAEGGGEGFGKSPDQKELYKRIQKIFALPDLDGALYVDLSHRLRHQSSSALCRDGGCAVIHHSPIGSLLTAMGVEEPYRGQGIGFRLATEALRSTAGSLWLFSADDRAQRLYQRIGWKEQGDYALLKGKE